MKILLAADIFPPESGGPATYVVALANQLTRLGDEVLVVSLNPQSDKGAVRCSLFAVHFKNKAFRYLEYFWLLFKNSKGVDVVYAMGPVNSGWPAMIVSKLRKKKFVVKVVGDYAWEQYMSSGVGVRSSEFGVRSSEVGVQSSEFGGCTSGASSFGVSSEVGVQSSEFGVHTRGASNFGNSSDKLSIDHFQERKIELPSKIKLLKKIERYVVWKADKVIVPSKYLKKIVGGWGAKNVEVIYNEVEYFSAEPISHNGEKWLVTVGRLVPWKGIDTLVDLISDISKQFPELNWKLKIIGDGPMWESLRSKVKLQKLESAVVLTGNLSRLETLSYMASADVFVLNSAYEGFSHSLIEAMNQGVPVLASNAGGNAEVVPPDNLFEYNNKEEIKKKVLFYANSGKGKNVLHKFGMMGMIAETKKLLESI